MLISELMAPELAAEMAMTRKLIARIPDDKLGWKPAEGLHTIGWNANHLVGIAGWVPVIVGQSDLDIASGPPPAEAADVKTLLAGFDDNLAKSLAALKGVPDSVMAEPWSLKSGAQILLTMPKGDCLRKWVFTHAAHHRGILSVYLRMAGVQVPSVYEE
jgi:uncharacterized damage-inducible protein DinB